jgi:hypothetical protein
MVETASESPVGRKTRRAEDVASRENCSASVLSRSVDVPPRRVWRGRTTIISWAMQPARMAQIRRDPACDVASLSPRRDPPPLRFGAALSCVVSRLEMGRDVGLAKSGFRPTGSWVPFRPLATWLRFFRNLSSRRELVRSYSKYEY